MKYMTQAHRREWMELILSTVAEDKLLSFPTFLQERFDRFKGLIGEMVAGCFLRFSYA